MKIHKTLNSLFYVAKHQEPKQDFQQIIKKFKEGLKTAKIYKNFPINNSNFLK